MAILPLAVLVLLLSFTTALAESISYGLVQINSAKSVQDGTANDSISNTTGATTQVGVNDSAGTTFAYSNGSGGFTFKPTTSNVFASSSLQTGELKTLAQLGFGTNLSGSAVMPLNQNHGGASSIASFGDSFRTFSGNSPFPWNDTSTSFTLNITGTSSVPSGLAVGTNESHNYVATILTIQIFQPGGLDIYNQLQNCTACTFDQLIALSNQLTAMTIESDFWYLGELVTDFFGFTVPSDKILPVNSSTPTEIEVDFTPGGDFDWVMRLDSTLFLDASLQNVSGTLDFSNTVAIEYLSPFGTSLFTASGLFPNSLPLSAAPTAVPEPASMLLFGSGLLGIAAFRTRFRKS